MSAAAITARADQIRAGIRQALSVPCSCDDCPTDEEMQMMLDLTDADLLRMVDSR